jgi:peptidoglycan/LPS O-acetylase OafA/YrhL
VPARIEVLDGLRGVAGGTVVLAHASLFAHPRTSGARWAVDLFFVLSGFLITRILLENRVIDQRPWTFWLNRAARIFPIYYLTVVVVWLVSRDALAPWAAVYLSNYRHAFVHAPSALNHTWSLCIEEHFYLIWPLIVGSMEPAASRRLILFAMIAGAILCPLLGDVSYDSVSSRVMSLGAGSLFAYAEPSFRRRPRSLVAVAAFAFGCSGALYLAWNPVVAAIGGNGIDTLFLLLTMATSAAGVLALALWSEDRRLLRRVLANPVLMNIGMVSYGLYLYHYPIFTALGVFQPRPDAARRAVLGIAVTFAAAVISYHAIEMPIRRAAKRVIARRYPTGATTT